MANAILTIGVPGSGKTTFAKNFAKEQNLDYICPDEIRHDRFEEGFDPENQTEVWREAKLQVRESLRENRSLLLDSTMVDKNSRVSMINFITSIDPEAEIIAMHFDVPLEICLERNANRERHVPEHVIKSMFNRLEHNPVSESEGFSNIIKLDEMGQEIRNEFKIPRS